MYSADFKPFLFLCGILLAYPAQASDLCDMVKKGDLASITQALQSGKNPNVRDPQSWLTPLMIATQENREDIVSVLLAHKANPNQIGLHRRTALHYAAGLTRYSILQKLLQAGGQTALTDLDGYTVSDYVCDNYPLKINRLPGVRFTGVKRAETSLPVDAQSDGMKKEEIMKLLGQYGSTRLQSSFAEIESSDDSTFDISTSRCRGYKADLSTPPLTQDTNFARSLLVFTDTSEVGQDRLRATQSNFMSAVHSGHAPILVSRALFDTIFFSSYLMAARIKKTPYAVTLHNYLYAKSKIHDDVSLYEREFQKIVQDQGIDNLLRHYYKTFILDAFPFDPDNWNVFKVGNNHTLLLPRALFDAYKKESKERGISLDMAAGLRISLCPQLSNATLFSYFQKARHGVFDGHSPVSSTSLTPSLSPDVLRYLLIARKEYIKKGITPGRRLVYFDGHGASDGSKIAGIERADFTTIMHDVNHIDPSACVVVSSCHASPDNLQTCVADVRCAMATTSVAGSIVTRSVHFSPNNERYLCFNKDFSNLLSSATHKFPVHRADMFKALTTNQPLPRIVHYKPHDSSYFVPIVHDADAAVVGPVTSCATDKPLSLAPHYKKYEGLNSIFLTSQYVPRELIFDQLVAIKAMRAGNYYVEKVTFQGSACKTVDAFVQNMVDTDSSDTLEQASLFVRRFSCSGGEYTNVFLMNDNDTLMCCCTGPDGQQYRYDNLTETLVPFEHTKPDDVPLHEAYAQQINNFDAVIASGVLKKSGYAAIGELLNRTLERKTTAMKLGAKTSDAGA